ncbi:hypothetical protein L798_04452 [Zootermopsis nevadensis]|uniref:Uncharacterized protein n=1 Tax=Zootermopsis nevadensis TaxID=136037 RepID=A0A067RM23_ZOONE|nr:hypothetical protein L798_04452 [Zootermopsis nevadensis]
MKSVKEERSQYSAKKNISTASRDKSNVSRRRNSVSRGNGRKDNAQSELMTTTTERTSPSRKRIPVRIRGAERDIQPANKDIASSSNTWRVSKRGRDNVLVGERPSSNPSQEGNNNASNETTALSVDGQQ